MKASVFVIHGMQDLNVRPKHFGQWWDALAKHGVERKIWLSQTGHVDPFDFRRATWVDTLHRWFDHELLGYDNGIDDEPMADIERHPDQWVTSAVWPPRTTHTVSLRPGTGDRPGVGTLGLRRQSGTREVHRRPEPERDRLVGADRQPDTRQGRLRHQAAHQGPARVRLVRRDRHRHPDHLDGPPHRRPGRPRPRHHPGLRRRRRGHHHAHRPHLLGPEHHRRQLLLPGDPGEDHACRLHDLQPRLGRPRQPRLGHKGVPLTPGKRYTITLDLHASDHVVPAGHRLALIVAGTDKDLIDPPSTTPTLTLDLSRTSAKVPLVGGAAAFARATGRRRHPEPVPPRRRTRPAAPPHRIPEAAE